MTSSVVCDVAIRTWYAFKTWGCRRPTIPRCWSGQRKKAALLTHDVSTITRYAYDRVKAGKSLPGVFEVSRDVPIRVAIEDILLLAEYSLDDEWEGQIRYLPLR